MNETTKDLYVKALATFNEARKELAEATIEYDRERHLARKSLYDLKESGTRKMTEEQIRSESVVKCQAIYERYTRALCAYDLARESLEFVKAIANN